MDGRMDTCIRWKEVKDRNWLNLWCYLAYHACKQKWYNRTVQQWLILSEAGDWPLQKKMKLPYLVNLEKHSIVLCHVESMRMQRDYFKTSREFVSLWERVEGIVSTGSVLLPLICLKGSREMSSKKVMQLKCPIPMQAAWEISRRNWKLCCNWKLLSYCHNGNLTHITGIP